MLKENALVKISEDMLIIAPRWISSIADVKALKAKSPKIGVSEFKDLTGSEQEIRDTPPGVPRPPADHPPRRRRTNDPVGAVKP